MDTTLHSGQYTGQDTGQDTVAGPGGTGELVSRNPATGEEVGRFPAYDGPAVDAAVARARVAARWWADLGADDRRRALLRWKGVLARRIEELARLVHDEGGKPVADARIEIALAIDHVDWAARHARRVLGRRRVPAGLLGINQVAEVDRLPWGVVAVIGPWNYPVLTPLGSIAYALAAGNAVVFKPSEHTPGVGRWLADSFADAVPDSPVFQVVTGGGDTGAALCRAGVDKVAFTGSTATGKRVMAACAETLTPVVIECGGKDVLIVDADADLDAAADAAVWGGMSNAGQTCIGIERVYAVAAVHDAFLAKVVERAGRIRAGADAAIGPMTIPAQLDTVRRHIADALARGGRAVVGGLHSVRPPYVDPVVMVDVPDDAPAVTEETFGPTLTVHRVADLDEAVRRANATRYGLGGAVFGGSRALAVARRLRVGMVSVNAVLMFAAVPALPFGGVGDSGFGRIHGEDGLREFTRTRSLTRQRFALPVPVMSFDRPARVDALLSRIVALRHGRG